MKTPSVLLSVFAALTLLAGLALSDTAFAGETLVREWEGMGRTDTRPFDISDGWEVQWENDGEGFNLFVYDDEGETIDIVVSGRGQRSGSLYMPLGGRYFIGVHAREGRWRIRILDID